MAENSFNWGRALAGFGEGYQGRGSQYLSGLREQDKQSALAQLGEQMASGEISQDQYIKQLATQDPATYSKIALAQYTNKAPAALQINSAIEEALKSGDTEKANRLAWLARSGAYGINTFGTPPAAPNQGQPQPMPTAEGQPQQPTAQQPSALAQMAPEYVPTGDSILPTPNSIAQQQAANAALEEEAKSAAKVRGSGEITPQQQMKIDREQAQQLGKFSLQAEMDNLTNINTVGERLLENADVWTTGFLGKAGSYIAGTPQADFEADLETVLADSALNKLMELKDSSDTGASGLGQVTEREISLLMASRAALSQSQSPEQFKENLARYLELRNKTVSRVAQQYKETYGSLPKELEGLVGGDDTGTESSGYKSADDVRSAFSSGKIKKDEAIKILKDQFGYE
jgi:hypothetical protein